ncbi:right-handed parallel beta-helix repeat-containing protein [Mucilaginibacter sp. HMF5004]|uniref:glycoside hydrolase family 28 protein n=1 Tax=Mucilaginibacter rivuli TaxID=2857527 RepID=UPI001C605166|nr:glycosyl hydrolase family 28 protein [Mucilaginibacter rivuli]MBW4891577.1 right-handed parallel beta-helix repeat-containing protein [Mucilaginibacter rivuli]
MKNKLSIALLAFSTLLATAAMATENGPKRYNIAEHGAVGDGTTLNTKAIQAVIDECAKKGGGTVVIPKGAFLSGAIFLKPGVNLEIQQDGILRGSQNIEDYPKSMRRIEGHSEPWRAALVNGDKVDHLHITGKGMLDGNGEPYWKLFYSRRSADRTTTNLSVERPQLTFIQNSKDVLIQGITFHNSGFWNLHLYRDQQVTVDNCRFEAPHGAVPNDHAPSSDGIDVDSSQDITITKCSFSVGDDDIALKGSKGPFAMQDKDSPPVERIHIYDCVFEAGGGIMTCGSEATIVRDVDIKRCTTTGPTVLRLKLRPDTPQQYENISLDDITINGPGVVILSVAPWTQYFDLKGQAPPTSLVRNIKLSNIKGTGGSLGIVKGNDGTTFEDITLKNFNVTLKNADYDVSKFKAPKLDNVVINGTSVKAPQSSTAK